MITKAGHVLPLTDAVEIDLTRTGFKELPPFAFVDCERLKKILFLETLERVGD